MLPIGAWLAVYTLVFYLLALVVRPWRTRSWFKALFFPGALLAVGLQKGVSLLCLSGRCKAYPLKDRQPPFSIGDSRVPFLAGALFVFLSHSLLYLVFLVAVTELEEAGWLEVDLVCLPTLHAYDMMEGYVEIDARAYLEGLSDFWDALAERPLAPLAMLYVLAGGFSSLTLSRRQFRWSLAVLLTIVVVGVIVDWFGTGFPFLSRGWWAGFSFFPRCRALFSLYVTSLFLVLGTFGLIRFLPLAIRRLCCPPGDEDERGARGRRQR